MPRQFGDGQHRQERQHPPVTHGLLARKLFRAFASTVPKEKLLTKASAALPSVDMPARARCYRRSFDENRHRRVLLRFERLQLYQFLFAPMPWGSFETCTARSNDVTC